MSYILMSTVMYKNFVKTRGRTDIQNGRSFHQGVSSFNFSEIRNRYRKVRSSTLLSIQVSPISIVNFFKLEVRDVQRRVSDTLLWCVFGVLKGIEVNAQHVALLNLGILYSQLALMSGDKVAKSKALSGFCCHYSVNSTLGPHYVWYPCFIV